MGTKPPKPWANMSPAMPVKCPDCSHRFYVRFYTYARVDLKVLKGGKGWRGQGIDPSQFQPSDSPTSS